LSLGSGIAVPCRSWTTAEVAYPNSTLSSPRCCAHPSVARSGNYCTQRLTLQLGHPLLDRACACGNQYTRGGSGKAVHRWLYPPSQHFELQGIEQPDSSWSAISKSCRRAASLIGPKRPTYASTTASTQGTTTGAQTWLLLRACEPVLLRSSKTLSVWLLYCFSARAWNQSIAAE
jgi:hypothetical protein